MVTLCITLLLVVSGPSVTTVSAFETKSNLPDNLFVAANKQQGTSNSTQEAQPPEKENILGEPRCNTVADTLVCDVNYVWNLANNNQSSFETSVEAAITCPLAAGSDPALTSINNPKECGCQAVLSRIVGSGANRTASPPTECSCEWCAGEEGSIDGLSVDCSSSSLENPNEVLGDCLAIGCDGSCRDNNNGNEEGGENTTSPIPPGTDMQDATPGSTTTNATTTAPATTSPPPATQAPTAAPLAERTLYYVPSAFYVFNDEQKKAKDLTTADQLGLHDAYVAFVNQIVAGMAGPVDEEPPPANPGGGNNTTTPNATRKTPNATRYLLRDSSPRQVFSTVTMRRLILCVEFCRARALRLFTLPTIGRLPK